MITKGITRDGAKTMVGRASVQVGRASVPAILFPPFLTPFPPFLKGGRGDYGSTGISPVLSFFFGGTGFPASAPIFM